MTLSALFYLVAVVLFIVAAVATIEFNLLAIGLACVSAGLLVSATGSNKRIG